MKKTILMLEALLKTVGLQAKSHKTHHAKEKTTHQKKRSGNPILPEFHADPEVMYSRQTGKFYINSTTDGAPGW